MPWKEGDGLTKAEKGRLKKLLKKASCTTNCSTSGITSFEEAKELRQLIIHQSTTVTAATTTTTVTAATTTTSPTRIFGPSILSVCSKSDSPDEWQRCEGTDHRALLLSILFHGSNDDHQTTVGDGKKRKRDSAKIDDNPRLPSWARLHNPGCVTNVAVVEISIEGGNHEKRQSLLMPSLRLESSTGDELTVLQALLSKQGFHGRKALPLCTTLFQGDTPRHVTDVLMYLDPPPRQDTQHKSIDSQDIFSLLEPHLLTRQQMEREGYPLSTDVNDIFNQQRQHLDVYNQVKTAAIRRQQTPDPTNKKAWAFSNTDAVDIVKQAAIQVIPLNNTVVAVMDQNLYVSTLLYRQHMPLSAPQVFAIDCEMVTTSTGAELARITLLQLDATTDMPESYKVLLDTLVQPYRPVINYLTKYSGITASMLKGVTIRIEHVQAQLLTLICHEDILIGHSLENDLRALRFVHDRVVDTSLLFRVHRKNSLSHLTKVLLNKNIQTKHGHCSEEDAAAALILAVRRARLGPTFQLFDKRNGRRRNMFHVLTEKRQDNAQPLPPVLVRKENGSLAGIGPNDWIMEHVAGNTNDAHALTCENIHVLSKVNALPSWLKCGPRRCALLWANLFVDVNDNKTVDELNKRIDSVLSSVVQQAPSSTMILFIFQQGFHRAEMLSKQRVAAQSPRCTLGWSVNQEEEWRKAMEVARSTEALWIGSV